MINLATETSPLGSGAGAGGAAGSGTAEKALSFISKGWREVRNSAGADLRLMRARADSFKHLADRELEHFLHSTALPPPLVETGAIVEIEFVKKLRPKLREIKRVYSSPEFGRKVLEKWSPKATVKIDLSAIKKAIVSEGDEFGGVLRWREKEEEIIEWEPIRKLKISLKEFEKKSNNGSSDIFGNFNSKELMEKFKLSLKSMVKEPDESKEVPPLDLPELLAYFVKQSEPFLDQLGIKKDTCDKIVDSLCSKRKDANQSDQSDRASLDLRIASVLQSTGHRSDQNPQNPQNPNSDPITTRHVAIVTTASLPWMTGTAVNPLFRAAYLARSSSNQKVTLVVPWLCQADQELVYPDRMTFGSPAEQEAYVRKWVEDRVGFSTDFKITFYPGKFAQERRSIIPTGDTTALIPSSESDIAILEEPEHLNWYHHGRRWTDRFSHVVGVVHTNYLEYIKREKFGGFQAFLVKHINNIVARAHCHKILRLSAATQDLPKSTICNVHGVNPKFLQIGSQNPPNFSKGAYFLGKMVWAKGYRELIDLLDQNRYELGEFKVDCFGSGQDSNEVKDVAKNLGVNVRFLNGRDHADDSIHGYKVFINPSVSDVLCTATAEALAMGKFVICADHPSNEFFRSFHNCLTYKTSEDFVLRVKEAMSREPKPLTAEEQYNLSWEAATERFMQYSDLDKIINNNNKGNNVKNVRKSVSMPNLSEMVDGSLACLHYCFTGNEILRLSTGAIPKTRVYDKQHCEDLKLLPPNVEDPIYGW